jgi:hypothetical protein
MLIALSAYSEQDSSKFNFFFIDNTSELLLDIKENLELNLSENTTKFTLTDELSFMFYSTKAPVSRNSIKNKYYSPILTSVYNRCLFDKLCLVITEDSFHFEGTVKEIQYFSDILNLEILNNIINHDAVLQSA